jgi:hypothetical protein
LVGWLTEGVIVQTMYADFPINLAWTGLAWHALISVMFGWYILRRVLLQNNPPKTTLVAGLAGSMWGIWAISWWSEDPITRNSPAVFAAFAFVTTGLLIASEWVFDRSIQADFAPNRWVLSGICGLLVLNFALVAVPAVPIAIPILLPLLALVLFALWRNRQTETGFNLFENLQGSIRPTNFAALLSMPATAAIVYTVADLFRLEARTNYLIFAFTIVAGTLLFIISLVKTLKQNTR